MLSSILNSKRPIQVNIQIMRTFTRLREIMGSHKDLARCLDDLEKKYDGQSKIVFEAPSGSSWLRRLSQREKSALI